MIFSLQWGWSGLSITSNGRPPSELALGICVHTPTIMEKLKLGHHDLKDLMELALGICVHTTTIMKKLKSGHHDLKYLMELALGICNMRAHSDHHEKAQRF